MSASDYKRMRGMGAALTDELIAFVQKHATEQHYAFAGGISIDLVEDADPSPRGCCRSTPRT